MTRTIVVKENVTIEDVLNIFRTPKEKYAFGSMFRFPNAIVLKSWKTSATSPTEIKLEWNDREWTTQSTLIKAATEEAAWNKFSNLIKFGKFRFVYKPNNEDHVDLQLVFDEMN